jgi:hypothetical protein
MPLLGHRPISTWAVRISLGNGGVTLHPPLQSIEQALLLPRFQKTGKRKDIFLATEFGIVRKPDLAVNGSAGYVKEAIEKSLKRLGVDVSILRP